MTESERLKESANLFNRAAERLSDSHPDLAARERFKAWVYLDAASNVQSLEADFEEKLQKISDQVSREVERIDTADLEDLEMAANGCGNESMILQLGVDGFARTGTCGNVKEGTGDDERHRISNENSLNA